MKNRMKREEILYYLDGFDVMKWLDSEGVEYSESGKNVSRGWVGVQCPFCDDDSDHLGINLDNNTTSCFRCHRGNGTIFKYMMKIKRCNFTQALKIVKEFGGGSVKEKKLKTKNLTLKEEINLDSFGFSKTLSEGAKSYLITRNFDPDFLVKKYKIMDGGVFGEYKYRVIVPFYKHHKVVGFTGRDWTGRAEIRYKTLDYEKWAYPPSKLLYNVETVKDFAVVVEGVTDVWRLGDGCCAIIGLKFTRSQVREIVNRGPRRVVIMLDEGAGDVARNLAHDLGTFLVGEVVVWKLPGGDPAELSEEEVIWFRRQVFGRIF